MGQKMKRNKILLLFVTGLCFLAVFLSAAGSEVTPSYLYRNETDPDFPKTLPVGWEKQCGSYVIKLLQDPVVTKSNQYMVADADTKYLVIRVAITNTGNEAGGWFAPDSFIIQDTYRGRIYGTYSLDLPLSAKVARGFYQPLFHAAIDPGDTLYTSLVFMVYPDVKSWLLTFAPHQYGEEPEETVRFQLPPAVFQEEVPERAEE